MRPTTSRKRAHVERKAHYYIVTKKVSPRCLRPGLGPRRS